MIDVSELTKQALETGGEKNIDLASKQEELNLRKAYLRRAIDSRRRAVFAKPIGNERSMKSRLTEAGSLQVKDKGKKSPLMRAAITGDAILMSMLLGAKLPDIQDRDANGLSAVNHAYVQGHYDLVGMMCQSGCENRFPLHYLYQIGAIRIIGFGRNLFNIRIRVDNKTTEAIKGVLLPGSIVHSMEENVQDMACTHPIEFEVPEFSYTVFDVNVVCTNAKKCVPRNTSTLNKATYDDPTLIKIIETMQGPSYTKGAMQAAVWAYKDKYTAEQIRTTVSSSTISPADILTAQQVLSRLGIK